MKDKIKVIDLFAGPGGLGEGFSAFEAGDQDFPFKIMASVEKEASAHKTLTLRAFFRQFPPGEVPAAYYHYVRSGGTEDLDVVFSEYKAQLQAARVETLGGPKALGGKDHDYIFEAISKSIVDHDGPKVVIGGPPCQAYSLVGRSRNKGKKEYRPEEDDRHFLYLEYLKVLDLVKPDVFVMENVKGILTAQVHGGSIFQKILEDLECPALALKSEAEEVEYDLYPLAAPLTGLGGSGGYRGKDYIIRSEEFGIPQARHRVILLGVRKNLGISISGDELLARWRVNVPVTPEKILDDLPKLRSGLTRTKPNDFHAWRSNLELGRKRVDCAPESTSDAKEAALRALERGAVEDLGQGQNFVPIERHCAPEMPSNLRYWYLDSRLKGVPNHQARNHMPEDLHRYLFASCYAHSHGGASPRASDYPERLAPAHKNWRSGHFADRFKVQARNRVASTVTSHISKDGHYFIHYDPAQCRSLTVREAARIQTFPDNYFFEGNRTEQYVQVGNAVPPLLANYIANVVFELLEGR